METPNENKNIEEVKETVEGTIHEKVIVNTKFDYKTMKYCNKYIIFYKNKAYLFSLILGLVVVGLGVYTLVTALLKDQSVLFSIIIMAMGIFMSYSAFNLESKIDAQLISYFNSNPVRDQVATITDEKISISHPGDEEHGIEYPWAYITEVHAIPEYYMLFVNKKTPLIIDRSDEAIIEGSQIELTNIIKDKAALKPFKEVNKNIVKKPITYVHTYVDPSTAEEAEVVSNEIVNDEQVSNEVVEGEVLSNEETTKADAVDVENKVESTDTDPENK